MFDKVINTPMAINLLLPGGYPFHIETSLLVFRTNYLSGFYIIGTSVMKELKHNFHIRHILKQIPSNV